MAGLKVNPHFDLFLFLAVISFIIFCFMEISLLWGVVSLAGGMIILLWWIVLRTEILR
ncbi:hypothetical protein J7K24_00875 [bacterium]|nr:hypothetical protein [bacterium]